MKYESARSLSDEDFKRSAGVHRSAFAKMLQVVGQGLRDFGRPPKSRRADQLLMTLMRWREYRAEFHIGLACGVGEPAVCRTTQKIEDTLIKSERFHLPGAKEIQSGRMELEIILVDATGQPIERPQKNSGGAAAAKRNAMRGKLKQSAG